MHSGWSDRVAASAMHSCCSNTDARHGQLGVECGRPYLILLQVGPGQSANDNRDSDDYSANYPAVTEPRRVDARPLRIDTRIGDRNRVTPRKPCNDLLSRVHHPMRHTVGVLELEYRIDLPRVP